MGIVGPVREQLSGLRDLVVRYAEQFATVVALMPKPPIPFERLVSDVLRWTDESLQQEWNRDLEAAPTDRYPIHSSVLARPQQWQPLETSFDRRAVIYDLTPPGQRYAFNASKAFRYRDHFSAKP